MPPARRWCCFLSADAGLPPELWTPNYIYWPVPLGHRELSMTQRHAHLSLDPVKRGAKVLEIARHLNTAA